MTRLRAKNAHLVVDMLVKGVHRAIDEVFDISQVWVPVLTGDLKRSGRVDKTDEGGNITYNVHYAAKQEFGLEPGATEGVTRHRVKAHGRRAKGKKVLVTTHFRGPFTRTYRRGLEGKLYLTRAFRRILPDLASLIAMRDDT